MLENKLETKKDLVKIFKKFNKEIYKYIFVRVNRRKEVAEDLTQDVFVKVWEKKDSFDSRKASIKTWIYVIARNKIIDHYRKNRMSTGRLEEKTVEGPEEIGIEHSLREYVLNKLFNLKEKEKELLTLYYIQELSIEEITKIINKKHSATKVAIHRALENLRKTVNENY